jgi:hypothetical protein
MNIGFTARGTKGGNVTVKYSDGREVSVTDSCDDATANMIAASYRGKYPVTATGNLVSHVEMD